jgi:5'-nucleotidase
MQERYLADYSPLPSYHLLVDSGDVFQGTPYFNLYGGQPELEWMSQMGYAASTLGNHEFDNGIEHLISAHKQHAQFPLVNCNYTFSGESFFKPYTVVERGPIRIGLTGVGINPDGLISERSMPGLGYLDPVQPLQNTVNHLREMEHCHLVFVLSHLGFQYDSDKIDDHKLASRTHGIDAILGGHTHTFLDKPVQVKNAQNKPVIINQAGWAGLRLGKLEFEVRA